MVQNLSNMNEYRMKSFSPIPVSRHLGPVHEKATWTVPLFILPNIFFTYANMYICIYKIFTYFPCIFIYFPFSSLPFFFFKQKQVIHWTYVCSLRLFYVHMLSLHHCFLCKRTPILCSSLAPHPFPYLPTHKRTSWNPCDSGEVDSTPRSGSRCSKGDSFSLPEVSSERGMKSNSGQWTCWEVCWAFQGTFFSPDRAVEEVSFASSGHHYRGK